MAKSNKQQKEQKRQQKQHKKVPPGLKVLKQPLQTTNNKKQKIKELRANLPTRRLSDEEMINSKILEMILRRIMVGIMSPALRECLVAHGIADNNSNIDPQDYLGKLLKLNAKSFNLQLTCLFRCKEARNCVAHGDKPAIYFYWGQYIIAWKFLLLSLGKNATANKI